MQAKFLKSVVESLINKQSSVIIDLLLGKKDVNEFLIAKKLELTINQTRNILYRLSDYGLVSFIRKKDKRKGWYIYFWTLNVYQSLSLLERKLKEKLDQLEGQLKSRSEKRYYVCDTCSIEVTEEVALLNNFTCSECEEVYKLAQQGENIKDLEKEISKIKKELELVVVERKKEEDKLERGKARKIKKSDEERKSKRAKKRAVRKKEKKAEKLKADKEDKKIKAKKKEKSKIRAKLSKVKKIIKKPVKKIKRSDKKLRIRAKKKTKDKKKGKVLRLLSKFRKKKK